MQAKGGDLDAPTETEGGGDMGERIRSAARNIVSRVRNAFGRGRRTGS